MAAVVRTRQGTVLLRAESLVVGRGRATVVTFDRAGRLFAFFDGDRLYRRALDGRIVEKAARRRRTLAPEEAAVVVARARAAAGEVQPPPGAEADALARAARFDLEADARRFRTIYEGPVPVLPPDLYRALVVQATVGCSHNACTFCSLYRDRPFRVPPEQEFARSVTRLREALGMGVSLRRGVFLGDADALVLDTPRLARMLEVAGTLPPARSGLFCFGAGTGEPARSPAEWRRLRALGLARVYVGLETGHDPLRARLGKAGTSEDVFRLVRAVKQAGIGVGLILLAGAGGKACEEAHVRASAAFCRRAALDGTDFVYLSPLLGPRGPAAGEAPLRRLRAALGLPAPPAGPRIARYDLRDFVY